VVHILAGIFLFLFIGNTLKIGSLRNKKSPKINSPILISFYTALIWITHPVNTQSVTYIVQRMTAMAAMFYLLSCLLYVKARVKKLSFREHKKDLDLNNRISVYCFYCGSILSGIFALACKETAATLPIFIFIYEWFFFQNLDIRWVKKKIFWISIVILLFGVVGLIFFRGNPINKILSLYISTLSIQHFTIIERLMTETRVLVYYISLFLFPDPSRLHLDYIYPISHSIVTPVTTLTCAIAIICLIALSVYKAKKYQIYSFCIIWFFGNLLIESSFIGLAPIFEHRTYLPFIGLSLLFILFINRLLPHKGSFFILLTIIACFLSLLTHQRNKSWQERSTFWQDNIIKSPLNPRPLIALGNIMLNNDEFEKAIRQYKKAVTLKTDYLQPYILLGDAFSQIDKFDDAIENYNYGLLLDSENTEILNKLGNAHVNKGEINQAISYYNKALEINPDSAMTYNNLGAAFFHQNNFDLAIKYYLLALKFQPDFTEARFNLALSLSKQGKINEAIIHYRHLIDKSPDNENGYLGLANLFFKQDNFEEAIKYYHKTLSINPEDERAYFNLGIAYYRLSNIDKALIYIELALSINPDYIQAKNTLTKLQSKSY
jgi:tetratricopeptide (TPR) repeat protein